MHVHVHVPGTSFAHFSVLASLISVRDQRFAPRIVLHVAWSPNTT